MKNKRKHKDTLIRCIRKAVGKTSNMLAEESGVQRQIVYRAEQQEIVTNENAVEIARALSINPDIMFYHMGKFPPDKIEFVKKDPLFFMKLIEDACSTPEKLVVTHEFMEKIKNTVDEVKERERKSINPCLDKLFSKAKLS